MIDFDAAASRVQRLARIVRMTAMLCDGDTLTTHDLQRHFGVGLRTVKRDLADLREAGLRIDFKFPDSYRLSGREF